MPFSPDRWRPMLRVETVVLIVAAWLIATVNGAWWSAVGAGRSWSDPANWLFTAEQRLFTNWYPFQLFNVGGAVFYDMGATWGRDPLGTPSQGLLRDVGFGLRLGSSRSALGNVLHIDVAYPLDGDDSVRKVQFLIETKKSF